MAEQAVIERTVAETLSRAGIADEQVSARTMRELVKVEAGIQSLVESVEEALKTLKESKLTKQRVAEVSGLARATLYNNEVVDAYVKARIEDNPVGSLVQREDKLRRELEDERRKVRLMQERDAEIILLRKRVEELENEMEVQRKNVENARACSKAVAKPRQLKAVKD